MRRTLIATMALALTVMAPPLALADGGGGSNGAGPASGAGAPGNGVSPNGAVTDPGKGAMRRHSMNAPTRSPGSAGTLGKSGCGSAATANSASQTSAGCK
jgi:hypothetical protein